MLNNFTHDGTLDVTRGHNMLELYKNIKNRRSMLGMTQSELAEKLGYADKSMIAKIEKGNVDLTQSKIFAFAKALNTTPSNLMGLDGIEKECVTDPIELQVLEGYRLAPEQIQIAVNTLLNVDNKKG